MFDNAHMPAERRAHHGPELPKRRPNKTSKAERKAEEGMSVAFEVGWGVRIWPAAVHAQGQGHEGRNSQCLLGGAASVPAWLIPQVLVQWVRP